MKPFKRMLLPAAAAVLLLLPGACRQADPSHPRTPADFVNPLIGTALENDGAVCPYVGLPYAMTKFTPQTAPASREAKIMTKNSTGPGSWGR